MSMSLSPLPAEQSSPITAPVSAFSPGFITPMSTRIRELEDCNRVLEALVASKQQDINRLQNYIDTDHNEHKKRFYSLRENLPVAAVATFKPSSTPFKPLQSPLSDYPSIEIMKRDVLSTVTTTCRLFAADKARNHKGSIRLKSAPGDQNLILDFRNAMTIVVESATKAFISLSATTAASNHEIVIYCIKGCFENLSEPVLKYAYSLLSLKLDAMNPSFSTLQSMVWAALVHGLSAVVAFAKPLRAAFGKEQTRDAITTSLATSATGNTSKTVASRSASGIQNEDAAIPVSDDDEPDLKKSSFLWRKAILVYDPPSILSNVVLGRYIQRLQAVTPIPGPELLLSLAAIEKGMLDRIIATDCATHLQCFKPAIMQLVMRLNGRGHQCSVSSFLENIVPRLLGLVYTVHCSDSSGLVSACIKQKAFKHGADANLTVSGILLHINSVGNSTVLPQLLQTLVKSLLPAYCNPTLLGDPHMWIQGLMDDLDLSSRESETSNKKTVWDDSVHILCKVLLHPDLDNITTEAADPIVGDLTYLNNDIRVFWALRVIGNTILCLFPHAATVSFWSTWPILPTKPMKSSVMQIFHLPPYCASAINSAIASTTNAAVLLSQPPPLSPGRVDEPIPQTKSKVGTSKAVQKPKPKQPANAKKPKISQVAATRTDSTMTTQFVDSRHPRRPVAKRGYEEVSGSDS